MSELREARARQGLSIAEASTRTRIPQRYLEALESGDPSVFPPGPFLVGYTRQYRTFLGLADAPATLPASERTETSPVAVLRDRRFRAGALAVALLVAGTLAWRVSAEMFDPPLPTVGTVQDQVVLVNVVNPVRARVVADGRVVHSGVLSPGAQRKFEAHDRLELDLAALDAVTLVYNGRSLKPLGAQSRPRRLVFIDDAE